MKYEDFPILSDNDYSLLREQYTTSNQTERKWIINEICKEISSCVNSCWPKENIFNQKLNIAIKDSYSTLSKTLNNLTSLFNIQTSKPQSIPTFSLFSYLKKINTIISTLFKWLSTEQKEYYKATASKAIEELLYSLNNIFSAAEESNIKFFKHM